jgi:hypothetical protein
MRIWIRNKNNFGSEQLLDSTTYITYLYCIQVQNKITIREQNDPTLHQIQEILKQELFRLEVVLLCAEGPHDGHVVLLLTHMLLHARLSNLNAMVLFTSASWLSPKVNGIRIQVGFFSGRYPPTYPDGNKWDQLGSVRIRIRKKVDLRIRIRIADLDPESLIFTLTYVFSRRF